MSTLGRMFVHHANASCETAAGVDTTIGLVCTKAWAGDEALLRRNESSPIPLGISSLRVPAYSG